MTIAVSIKVNDGIVLASDSASTLIAKDGGVAIIYENANKIFNLHRKIPIGGMFFGAGSIGEESISTLVKDLRAHLEKDPDKGGIDTNNYTVKDIAEEVDKAIIKDKYEVFFKSSEKKPAFGFFVAGYSCRNGVKSTLSELWLIEVSEGVAKAPVCKRKEKEDGINWGGNLEALNRLILGHGQILPQALKDIGIADSQVGPAMKHIIELSTSSFALPSMPIQDVIDLAKFFVYTTIMYSKFLPGAPTVGGPIEIAAITKHEGFKWVQRKHYYDRRFNPES
jgi:hypothetical protein